MYSSLTEANTIIEGDRKDQYGNPEDAFGDIAAYWNVHMVNKGYIDAWQLTAEDIAIMMVLMKVAREENQHKRDNAIDAIGYLALYADRLHSDSKEDK